MPSNAKTWTTDRIERLKAHFEAGLSCREIAAQLGVSRNAVIGKLSRLSLTRGRIIEKRQSKKRPVGGAALRNVPRLRHQLLLRILQAEPEPSLEGEAIHDGHSCSLFELSKERCRWPINTPGAADFCFCGNPPVTGLPYCPGHSRMAYRVTAGQR